MTSTVSEVSQCRSPLQYLPSSPICQTLMQMRCLTVVVHHRWYCPLWRRPPLLMKPHGLLRSFSLTGTIFLSILSHFARISRADHSTSQVLTTSHVVFIITFTAGLLQKPPCINQTSSDWSTAVTSHTAVNGDARSIPISSQNIRIHC